MGWTDSHLHEFVIGSQRYGIPDPDAAISTVLPDRRVRLQDVAPLAGGRFVYRYDFGDGWEHEVVVASGGTAWSAGRLWWAWRV
jgi:hypothetical protein